MYHARLLASIALAILFTFLCAKPVCATKIDPLLWEELVLGADFVGVAECEEAGGIVARYKVVESWKGPKAGTWITIQVAVNYWGQQFPITLCGERYLITAYKVPPSNLISTSLGRGVPLWWRHIPADYDLPLFQGRELLRPGEAKEPEFEKLRKETQALLALKPAEREAVLLRALIKKDLLGGRWIGGEEDSDKKEKLRKKLADAATTDALVTELLHLVEKDSKKWAVRVRIVLEKGGGEIALKHLEKVPADNSRWTKEDFPHTGKEKFEDLLRTIRTRLKPVEQRPDEKKPSPEEKPPSRAKLKELRKALTAESSEQFDEAFRVLTRHDPAAVAEYLAGWKNSAETEEKDRRGGFVRGYVMGSYFAWRCGKEREQHFKTLLGAKDPYIRVTGAVYLCFENKESGIAELKKLTKLEGDAGVWAALTLARRGHKDAVPRALEVFREKLLSDEEKLKQTGMSGVPRETLQQRVLVLLSNSAHAGKVPQLVLPKEDAQTFDYLVEWWKAQTDKVVLRDPWMEILEKQKID